MTCIVGLVEDNQMWIGSDTQASGENDILLIKNHKIFEKGPFLIGHTGSPRANQIIQHGPNPPRLTAKRRENLMGFMCNQFIDYMMGSFIAAGWARSAEGRVEIDDAFLVLVGGHIFSIWADFQVIETEENYFSIGSGSPSALGSLYTSEGGPPEDRIEIAIKAASHFSAGVGGHIDLLKKRFK
jgi:ATP-dependent protease HslVU (ClpYQ) peptidase subunit